MNHFAEFWSLYPRHVGKLAAEKAYKKASQRFSPAVILTCLEIMKATDWRKRKLEFIPHAATWLRATDFGEEFDVIDKHYIRPLFQKDPHWCPMCETPHAWNCQDHPLCGLSYEVACPQFTRSLGKKVGKCTPA